MTVYTMFFLLAATTEKLACLVTVMGFSSAWAFVELIFWLFTLSAYEWYTRLLLLVK
jgi:hypothetical protein